MSQKGGTPRGDPPKELKLSRRQCHEQRDVGLTHRAVGPKQLGSAPNFVASFRLLAKTVATGLLFQRTCCLALR